MYFLEIYIFYKLFYIKYIYMRFSYKHIVLILAVLIIIYLIKNYRCSVSKNKRKIKESFTDPNVLYRTFNADQFLKNLHVSSDNMEPKQKIINAITSPNITPYIKYLEYDEAEKIIQTLFYDNVTDSNIYKSIEQLIRDNLDPSIQSFINFQDITTLEYIDVKNSLSSELDKIISNDIDEYGSFFGIKKINNTIYIPSTDEFKKNILLNKGKILNKIKEPEDELFQENVFIPKANSEKYVNIENNNIIVKKSDSNGNEVKESYEINENVVNTIQLNSIPSYLKLRVRNNRDLLGNALANVINSYAIHKEWGWKRTNAAGIIISDTTCTPEIVYVMTKQKLNKIVNLNIEDIPRNKYFLESENISKNQSKEIFDLLLNIKIKDNSSDLTSVNTNFTNYEGIKVFNELNQEKTTEKVQTVFEILNNNINKINMYNFIKPKQGETIDALGFPLERTDCFPEGNIIEYLNDENILINNEKRNNIDYNKLIPILSDYSNNTVNTYKKKYNVETFSNNIIENVDADDGQNVVATISGDPDQTGLTNTDALFSTAEEAIEAVNDATGDLVNIIDELKSDKNMSVPAPAPLLDPKLKSLKIRLDKSEYFDPIPIKRGLISKENEFSPDKSSESPHKGALQVGEFIYYGNDPSDTTKRLLEVEIDAETGTKIYKDPKKNSQIQSENLIINTETFWKIDIFKKISQNLKEDDPIEGPKNPLNADLAILNTVIANFISYDPYLIKRANQMNEQVYDNDFIINDNDGGKIRTNKLKDENNNDMEVSHISKIDNFYPGNDNKYNLPFPIKFKDPYPFTWPDNTQQRQWAFDNEEIVLRRMTVNVNGNLVESDKEGPLESYQTESSVEYDELTNQTITKHKIINEGERIVGPLGNIIVVPTYVNGKKVYYDKNTNMYELDKIDLSLPIEWKSLFLYHRFLEIDNHPTMNNQDKYDLKRELVLINILLPSRVNAIKTKKQSKLHIIPTNTVELIINKLSFFDEIAPYNNVTNSRNHKILDEIYYKIAEFFTDTNIISSCSQPIVYAEQIKTFNRMNLASLYENNLLRIEKIIIKNKCYLTDAITNEPFLDILKNKIYFFNYNDVERLQRAINSSFNTYIDPSDELQDILYHGSRLNYIFQNKYSNHDDFVNERVLDEDKDRFRNLINIVKLIKWMDLNLDTDKRDMEIEQNVYYYFDYVSNEYKKGLQLDDINFLYKYVTLEDYFSVTLELKAGKLDVFFHEQDELIEENILITRKKIILNKCENEVNNFYNNNNNNIPEPKYDIYDNVNTKEELINLRFGEIMRSSELIKEYVNENEILELYDYKTARSVINILKERSSALSLDKQNVILEAIKENIIHRFCSKDDCMIHFKDVVDEHITLTTPFYIIKKFHMDHHLDKVHSHKNDSPHIHTHDNVSNFTDDHKNLYENFTNDIYPSNYNLKYANFN